MKELLVSSSFNCDKSNETIQGTPKNETRKIKYESVARIWRLKFYGITSSHIFPAHATWNQTILMNDRHRILSMLWMGLYGSLIKV